MLKTPLFITFEGLEGSGKSVQAGLLAGKLREEGYDIVATREPGGTRIGEQIRTITHDLQNVDLTAVAECYLMAAQRAQHVREIIKPALEAGKIVICDRFLDSSIVYQGFGREMGENVVRTLNKEAVEGIIPDVTFYLSVTFDEGLKRRRKTDKVDRLDLQPVDFYDRVITGYELLAKEESKRIISIDGMRSIDVIAKEIRQILQKVLR